MIDAIRSEWVKLRSVRLSLVLSIIGVAFPLVVTVLTSVFADAEGWSVTDIASLVTGTSVVTGLMLGVVGAAGVTSEYGFGTIRVTFAATPRRGRVVTAKMVVTLGLAVVVQLVVIVTAFPVGALVFESRGASLDMTDRFGDAVSALVGVVAFAAILSVLGLAIGLVVRATPAAIAILVLWPLIIENIIGALLYAAGFEGALDWLPYSAGFRLTAVDPGDQALGRVLGGLYFAAWTTAVLVLGSVLARRRDA